MTREDWLELFGYWHTRSVDPDLDEGLPYMKPVHPAYAALNEWFETEFGEEF